MGGVRSFYFASMLSGSRAIFTHGLRRSLVLPQVRLFCISEEDMKNNPVFQNIQKDVEQHKLLVFMKGVPEQPQCGFSNAVIQALQMNGVANIEARNVLVDPDLREGIKKFSDWPTIPQVYVAGEFIGGCDIVLNMHKSGELKELLTKESIVQAE